MRRVTAVALMMVVVPAGCPQRERTHAALDETPGEGDPTPVALDDRPWEGAGTEAGQEIIGPDGGITVWVTPGEFMMRSPPTGCGSRRASGLASMM